MNISDYDLKFKGLTKNSMESIPIGNGHAGANVWVENNELNVLFSHTDAWSELARLLKTGYIAVKLTPCPFNKKTIFHLSINEGVLYIKANDTTITLWVDVNDIYCIDISSSIKISAEIRIINYRNKPYFPNENDATNYFVKSSNGTRPIYDLPENADGFFYQDNGIGVYHRNNHSCYDFSLEFQGLENFEDKCDPLINRTFGFFAQSPQMSVKSNKLVCENQNNIFINVKTVVKQCEQVSDWISKATEVVLCSLENHKKYWHSLWGSGIVELKGGKKAKLITQSYLLQRYMNLCAGLGEQPIKFNGSIFTCQPSPYDNEPNYDYRLWGGPYWLQNTRLIYWSMLFSGDYQQMKPFFNMYFNTLSISKYRAKEYYQADGAVYPETMSFFGLFAFDNYGINRNGKSKGDIENEYIRYYFSGALEVAFLMLNYYEHTQEKDFYIKAQEFVFQVLSFFKSHFETVNGKLKILPTSSLETWQNCEDDTPTIAGLLAVSQKVLSFTQINDKLKKLCENILNITPSIPIDNNKIMPYYKNFDKMKNVENTELYTVFPYMLYSFKNETKLAINTYKARKIKEQCGWQQHAVQASMLGLSNETFKQIIKNYKNTNKKCVFPSFYGPNYDWLPDQDNGNVANMALASSLVQYDENGIYIFPAFNKKYDVEFILPVGKNNFITVKRFKGKVEYSFKNEEKRQVRIKINNSFETI